MAKNKLTTWQLMLISTGGMIGAGWLFSPYYGFQTAGVGVLLSWAIIAALILVIGVSFAEVITIIPVVGGISRFIGLTHNRAVSFVFLTLGWLSYVVYLPLEAQSVIQYLSFWFKDLVEITDGSTRLSNIGLAIAFFVIALLTWFNTRLLKNVARVNSWISIWKILVPIALAWVLIIMFGKFENVEIAKSNHEFSFENVLLAITGSGIAFAFTGFQNGLILANSAKNPHKSLPYSLFAPIIIGFILYSSLSMIYITCLGDKHLELGSAAPLLAIISLFGIHWIITILFIDAVIAPLGTANVYVASTSRILLGLGKEFFPRSLLNRLNKFASPANCLWINAIIGACFLMPFPTWQQLVDFLSSIVVFSYISGPIVMMILRKDFPNLERSFKVSNYKLVGYLGFISCSLMVYWSHINNLIYLAALSAAMIVVYNFFVEKKPEKLLHTFFNNFFVSIYLASLVLIKYIHKIGLIAFPYDNLLVIILAIIFCYIFLLKKVSRREIDDNLQRVAFENDE